MSAVPDERLAFAALFLAGFLIFLGLGIVIPVLPRYVKGQIGGGDFAYEPSEEDFTGIRGLESVEPAPLQIVALEVELGGGRVERCAVVEHHAAAQAKRVGEPVGTDRP